MSEPHPDDVMRAALAGAGFMPRSQAPELLWHMLFPVVKHMEATTILDGKVNEADIASAIRSVTEGILARHRYAAGLKAKTKKTKKAGKP